MRRRPLLVGLSIGLSVGLTLAGLELALRVHDYLWGGAAAREEEARRAREASVWQAADDPVLIYEHRPSYVKNGVRYTEAHGILRPEDAERIKPAGVYRLALVGDSVAAALDLRYEERFGSLVEEMLTAAGRPAEVLNFAVNGYRTTQEARVVESSVAPFEPDGIVLQYCPNDPGNSITPTIWFLDRPHRGSRLMSFLSSRLGLDHGDPRLSDQVPTFGPDYGSADYWFRLYEPGSASWRSVETGFQRIAEYATTRDTPVLLVIFPFLLDTTNGWEIGAPFYEQVAEAGSAVGFEVLNLAQPFSAEPIASLLHKPGDIYHPSARGHQIAAAAVHARLASW